MNAKITGNLKRSDAVAATCSCDASSQKVGATPTSRAKPGKPFGLAVGSGDEASPGLSATVASQLRARQLRLSTAWFRLMRVSTLAALLLIGFAVQVAGAVDGSTTGTDAPVLSLAIRCTNEIVKVGDEIPIQFVISNRGTVDCKYNDRNYDRGGRIWEYKLVAKTASGEIVPDARQHFRPGMMGGLFQFGVLHPGESVSKVIALNLWALIKEPGQYEVTGVYSDDSRNATSGPVSITVFPRTEAEMHDYIRELTNNVAPSGMSEDLVKKLMFTCSPEIVPILLKVMSTEGGNANFWATAALADYVPRTEETRKAILDAATEHGVNGTGLEQVLLAHEFDNKEMKPVIERALAANHPGEWRAGVWLALRYYDDAFTTPLIAIANDSNARWDTRSVAMRALTFHRTDAGVKAIKALLKDPAPDMLNPLAETIANGYAHLDKDSTARPLKPEDFSAEDLRPLIEQLLVSTNQALQLQLQGALLAKQFGSDGLTAQLVALTTNSSSYVRYEAICALALNRTDEGVKTLKTLLNSSDPQISKTAEAAIRNAYTSHGDARGRPLRADDFDEKFQRPEPLK